MIVIFDSLRGEALIGSLHVGIADAGSNGELQIDGGAVLRPVSFGQRTRIVARAALTTQPRASIAAGLLRAATVEPGANDPLLLEVLALALAGADRPALPFCETALLVARGAGWHYAEIAEAEAAEIDRFAQALAPDQPDDGWNRLLFGTSADELTALRDECADNLLRRVGIPITPSQSKDQDEFSPAPYQRRSAAAGTSGGEQIVLDSQSLPSQNVNAGLDRRAGKFSPERTPFRFRMKASHVAEKPPSTTGGPAQRGENSPISHNQPSATARGSALGGYSPRTSIYSSDYASAYRTYDIQGAITTPTAEFTSPLSSGIAPVHAFEALVNAETITPKHQATVTIGSSSLEIEALADLLAAALHDEADLRGIDR